MKLILRILHPVNDKIFSRYLAALDKWLTLIQLLRAIQFKRNCINSLTITFNVTLYIHLLVDHFVFTVSTLTSSCVLPTIQTGPTKSMHQTFLSWLKLKQKNTRTRGAFEWYTF